MAVLTIIFLFSFAALCNQCAAPIEDKVDVGEEGDTDADTDTNEDSNSDDDSDGSWDGLFYTKNTVVLNVVYTMP